MARQKQPRPVFVCQECGFESPKWAGRCPDCLSWNTFEERTGRPAPKTHLTGTGQAAPLELPDVRGEDHERVRSGTGEFDRVLGGGVVPGSLVLIGGDPGIGKSTLLLQAAAELASPQRPVLYLSGEESAHQLKLRATRLGLRGEGLYLITETDLSEALRAAEGLTPGLLVVDSIQTVFWPEVPSAAGSVSQLRECTLRLMQWAKTTHIPTFIVGHVTKEGEIAGPRLLEHIVDVVLYLEGERFSSYRLLRGVKNRFGAVSEIGVFEMRDRGLAEVPNPSEVFLAERAEGEVGSVVVPTLEGSRPLLVEVQALTTSSALSMPRRTANGIDFNRLILITAVLTKRLGLSLGSQDILVNVVGGLRLQEPAADLAVALAIASSFRDARVPGDLVAIGEVGLSGELRSVSYLDRRLAEAERLGFRRCILPRASLRRGRPSTGMDLVPAGTLEEAVREALA